MAKINDEIRQAIRERGGAPVELLDPETNAVYFLVTEEQFQRMRVLFAAEPFDVSESYRAQFEAMDRAGWGDPAMDAPIWRSRKTAS